MTTAKLPEDLKIRQLARIRDDLNRLRSEQVLLTAVGLHAMVVGSLITLRSCRILTGIRKGGYCSRKLTLRWMAPQDPPGCLRRPGELSFKLL